jgi:tetratricopeptide (TPR) repeat protein
LNSDRLAEVERLRLRAVELNGAGRPVVAARTLRRALRLLGALPAGRAPTRAAADLAVRVTATLAHSEAELGHVDAAAALLREAMERRHGPPDETTGVLLNQSGLLRLRQGRVAESIQEFDRALAVLGDHPVSQCAVLLNRSAAHLYCGRVRQAGEDLERCTALAAQQEHGVLEAKARHNLGYLALLRGDLPEALRDLAAAHDALREVAPGYSGVILVDRARALRDAGLLDEADIELREATEVLAQHRLDQDLGEAQLVRAEVALLAARSGDARRHATVARRRFLHRRNHSWALLADLVLAQTAKGSGAAALRSAERARGLAQQLAEAGLGEDARLASLAADRIELRCGRAPRAPAALPGDRAAARLQVRLVRAGAAGLAGDRAAVRRELRQGLIDLHRYRTGSGSYDLQTGMGLHGRELIDAALREALRDGRPSVVHSWVERTRAVALRTVAVHPPPDPLLAAALAEVRAVRAAQRASLLAGHRADPALAARRIELERRVRHRSWQVDGVGQQDRTVGLGRVRAELTPAGGSLVSYLRVGTALSALVVTSRSARVVELGELAVVDAAIERLRADLDAAARGGLPHPVRQVIVRSTAAGLTALDTVLWRPLARRAGNGPVVIVPTGTLSAVPWTGLSGLRGRPVTVASSATAWCRRSRRPSVPAGRVLAAGPGLARAGDEVRAIAAGRPDAAVAVGRTATAANVLRLAEGRGVLHLAAHGRHEPQNPLFSCVELADGPLFGHDLPRVERMPAHVVLSACDIGLAVVRAGDEPLGMTAAFLHAGASSVVSSIARVGDEAAYTVMVAYHERLGRGRTPAEALAEALDQHARDRPDQPAPFVGYGAAW